MLLVIMLLSQEILVISTHPIHSIPTTIITMASFRVILLAMALIQAFPLLHLYNCSNLTMVHNQQGCTILDHKIHMINLAFSLTHKAVSNNYLIHMLCSLQERITMDTLISSRSSSNNDSFIHLLLLILLCKLIFNNSQLMIRVSSFNSNLLINRIM